MFWGSYAGTVDNVTVQNLVYVIIPDYFDHAERQL